VRFYSNRTEFIRVGENNSHTHMSVDIHLHPKQRLEINALQI